MADNYNKIITTLNSVSSNYTFIPDQDNVIVIDTSNNRIGINTVNPEHAIDVCGGTIKSNNLIIDNSASIYEGSFNKISSNLIPNVDNVHSLGDASNQWHSLFVGPGSIYLNKDKLISKDLLTNDLVINYDGVIRFPGSVRLDKPSLAGEGIADNNANIAGGYIYSTPIGITSSEGGLSMAEGHFTDVNVQNLTVSLNTVLQGRLDAFDASFANIDISKNLNVLQDLVVSGRNITDSLNIIDNSINLLNTYVTDVVDNSINNLLTSNFDASFSNIDVSGNIGGTLTTPFQTNVTSVGELTSLSVAGTISTMYIKSPENQTTDNIEAAAELRLESGNNVGGGNSEILIQPYGISYQANSQNFFNGTGATSCQVKINGVLEFSSDDRLKHNEVDVTNALVIVRKLIAQKYQKTAEIKDADFNGELTEDYIEETGFIAQEIMKIPELSYCVSDGKTLSGKDIYYLNYTDIFVINVQAVKELDAIVTAQATSIAALEARLTALEG